MSAAARIIEKRYDFSTNLAMTVLLLVVAIGTVTVGSRQRDMVDDDAGAVSVSVEPSPASMY